jgi:hypothetical protein
MREMSAFSKWRKVDNRALKGLRVRFGQIDNSHIGTEPPIASP